MSVHTSTRLWICERMRQCLCVWVHEFRRMCEYVHAGVTACGHVTCECEWMVRVRICVSVCEQVWWHMLCAHMYMVACLCYSVCMCVCPSVGQWEWVCQSIPGRAVIMCVLGCWCVGTSIWMYMQVWAWELVHSWVWMCLCAQLFVSVCVPICLYGRELVKEYT